MDPNRNVHVFRTLLSHVATLIKVSRSTFTGTEPPPPALRANRKTNETTTKVLVSYQCLNGSRSHFKSDSKNVLMQRYSESKRSVHDVQFIIIKTQVCSSQTHYGDM